MYVLVHELQDGDHFVRDREKVQNTNLNLFLTMHLSLDFKLVYSFFRLAETTETSTSEKCTAIFNGRHNEN